MKKFLILLGLLFITGCTSIVNPYFTLINDIKSQTSSSEFIPFDIKITVDSLDDELRYTVVIDNPEKDYTEVSALVIHNLELTDSFPSVGIVDDPLNLSKEKSEGFSKGIILVGYLPRGVDDIEFKVMINFKDGDKLNRIYYIENVTI